MKNYNNFIKEEVENENELKIIELSYYDFISLCDIYKSIDFKDANGYDICKVVELVKQDPGKVGFSNKSNKYHFLAAIQNKILLGVFYKQLRGNPDLYDDGYIISKGAAQELLSEMRKLGPYTTYSKLNNIGSLKSQIKMGGEFICITDSDPTKPIGTFTKEFSDNQLKDLMIGEKIYFIGGDEKFFFYDEKGNFKIKELTEFLNSNKHITVVEPKEGITSNIKLYFLFNKL
jgi:hypothetical protein